MSVTSENFRYAPSRRRAYLDEQAALLERSSKACSSDDSFCLVSPHRLDHAEELVGDLAGLGVSSGGDAVAHPLPNAQLRSGAGRSASTPKATSAPAAIRGGSKNEGLASSACVPLTPLPIWGGYDGGTEVGFQGEWIRERYHSELVDELNHRRDECPVGDTFDLFGRLVAVNRTGARAGSYYKHVIQTDGVRIYVHDNLDLDKSQQPVRVCYESTALTGRCLFEVHERIVDWLREVGFNVDREILSRVDMQVMVPVETSKFVSLLREGHVVRRGVNFQFHGDGSGDVNFSVGGQTRLRIYDKIKELLQTRNLVGMELLRTLCFRGELPPQLTRVEFQLRRDVLRDFSIDTLKHLLDSEKSLVDYLTLTWFRILAEPKQKGHAHEQRLHPLWEKVRRTFHRHFSGTTSPRCITSAATRPKIQCAPSHLLAQAAGCLASVVALNSGGVQSDDEAFGRMVKLLMLAKSGTAEKINERTAVDWVS